jgi:hypothetical protein
MIGLLLVTACPGSPTVQEQQRVANPTVRGVVCDVSPAGDTAEESPESSCFAMFDECSDGLTYELQCRDSRCNCIVDGDKLGNFKPQGTPMCNVDIDELKVLCGWIPADGSERIPVPER